MGLKCAPDFVQQIMEQVLCGLNNVEMTLMTLVYLAWHGGTEYQVLLDKVLSCLEA